MISFRGQGIARKLLEMCIKTAVEEGFRVS